MDGEAPQEGGGPLTPSKAPARASAAPTAPQRDAGEEDLRPELLRREDETLRGAGHGQTHAARRLFT